MTLAKEGASIMPIAKITPAERRAQLEQELAVLDSSRTQAQRAVEVDATHAAVIEARIETIHSATSALAAVDVEIPRLAQWVDNLTAWRKTLCDELLALPPRIRTGPELGKQQNLKLSIITIDRGRVSEDTGYALETLRLGQLMREAGYVPAAPLENQVFGKLPWFGSMPDVERRLKALQARRAEAQARLDEALLDDAERERLAAEDKVRRDALNAAPQRKVRGDGSQYDRYPDGRVVEVTS